jgi:hypothetical protein
MFLAKALRKLTLAAMIVCYVTLGGFIAFFPIAYLGEIIIYPYWRWAPLVNRMPIKDSMPYFFALAIACTFLQLFDTFLSRWTGGGQNFADDAADSTRGDSPI